MLNRLYHRLPYLIAAVGIGFVPLLGVIDAAGQEASPTVGEPETCTVEAQSAEWFLTAYATDLETRSVDDYRDEGSLPEGESVGTAVETDLNGLWFQLLSCRAEQSFAEIASLVTPGYFVELYPNLTVHELAAGDTNELWAEPPQWPLTEFRLVEEGVVVAHLDMGSVASPEFEETNHVRFVEQEGSWLIDNIVAAGG